ncbi:MAG TPA: XdhC family protein [Steroidobacteraceae bacterium]|nr:XdhC family protein [Steroidobacteraceae bacterium]
MLATIVETIGSTYRKAGAQMLITQDGNAAGLLSGGCLEADLMDHARSVFESGTPKIVEYDARGSDDLIWGIGLGCEGAMKILLTRLDSQSGYEPFASIVRYRNEERHGAVAVAIASDTPDVAVGSWFVESARAPEFIRSSLANPPKQPVTLKDETVSLLVIPIRIPLRLVVLGAGPDALPVVEIAAQLGWRVTVTDHRPAYARADKFPRAHQVIQQPALELASLLKARSFDAAVVMSHHLISDEHYLRQLANSSLPYIGLLGPAPRRARLMAQLGEIAQLLGNRLHGPIGLDLGADTPETIALAIVSEIQAVLAGRSGLSFSKTAPK